MITSPLSNLDRDATDPHLFTAWGSDLGITARYIHENNGWPHIQVPGLGNGQPFIPYRFEVRDGDLQYVQYKQGNGIIRLKVYND
jgi:hypothetical protein